MNWLVFVALKAGTCFWKWKKVTEAMKSRLLYPTVLEEDVTSSNFSSMTNQSTSQAVCISTC